MVGKFIDECTKIIGEEKLTPTGNENNYNCNSCTGYIVLFSVFFIISVRNGAYFAYYKYRSRNKKMFLDIMIMYIINNIKWEK